jgi:predicted AlkP superfamily pyrophosphatase or phosphodiesterase
MLFAAAKSTVASAYDAHPKLIVIVIIDQFRGDYLERYRADFTSPNGFRLLTDRSAYFPDCYYDYANTETAPGHATLATGAYSDGHGIAGNTWWDLDRNSQRAVSSIEDSRYPLVGPAQDATRGASPNNLLASTLGDELRLATDGASRVYAVSLKDRAAILSGGAAANGAYWIDRKTGKFITSTYYADALPPWASSFNASDAASRAATAANISNFTDFFDQVGATPAANAYELAFAQALITAEQLGTRNTTDLLIVSLSANDEAGHSPNGLLRERAMVDSLDHDLADFFGFLDKTVPGGLSNVWIALSADHGVAPTPSMARDAGYPSANFNVAKLTAAINSSLNTKFSAGQQIAYVLPNQWPPYLDLDYRAFQKSGVAEQQAEDAAIAALNDAQAEAAVPAPAQRRQPQKVNFVRAYSRVALSRGEYPAGQFGEILAHSYSPNGGWYIMIVPQAYEIPGTDPTRANHGSAWSYDRHVPLALYGSPFAPGTHLERVQPIDLAATFAALLGLNQPSASVGHVLTQALRPAASLSTNASAETH